MSRYALWLLPLAVPFLRRVHLLTPQAWRRGLIGVAALSAIVNAWIFHPSVPECTYEPTPAAAYLWTRHPGWQNPVPEVFSECLLHQSEPSAPVATAGCEKVLILGNGNGKALWPIPCFPDQVPAWCQKQGALCYANRSGETYDFSPAKERLPGTERRLKAAWPPESERYVREWFSDWRWHELSLFRGRAGVVQAATGVNDVWTWLGPDRLIAVITTTPGESELVLRLPRPMAGSVVEASTGNVLRSVGWPQSANGEYSLDLRSDVSQVLLVALTASAPKSENRGAAFHPVLSSASY